MSSQKKKNGACSLSFHPLPELNEKNQNRTRKINRKKTNWFKKKRVFKSNNKSNKPKSKKMSVA